MKSKYLFLIVICFFGILVFTQNSLADEFEIGDPETMEIPDYPFENFTEKTVPANSSLTTLRVSEPRPPFGDYRGKNQDFGWHYSWDTEGKYIHYIQLKILAWDVDYSQGEYDRVYVDGHYVGNLHGSNEQWYMTYLYISTSYLTDNDQMDVFVDIDSRGETWKVEINYADLDIDWDYPVPYARAGGPYSGYEGLPMTFDASESYTYPSGGTLYYQWDFNNDGNWDTPFLEDPITTYAYDDDWVGYARLRIKSGERFGYATASVMVDNIAPSVVAGSDQFIDTGAEVYFLGSFYDPGILDDHIIEWDFGDSTNCAGTLTPSHTYANDGTYTVKLTVTDDDGGVGSDTLIVTTAENLPPSVDAGPNQFLSEGQVMSFTGSFTDPGSYTHTIYWNFGDGNGETGTLTPSHYYEDDGIYEVTLTVVDWFGEVGSDTMMATIYNVAPSVNAGPDYVVKKREPIFFHPTASDPIDDISTYSWDFESDGIIDSYLESPMHFYTESGTYTVTLEVTDDDGGIGIDTCEVIVTDDFFYVLIDDNDPTINWATTEANNEWCTGSGTPSDPYIIKDLSIDGHRLVECLTIRNSEKYFIVKDCEVFNSKLRPSGQVVYFGGIRLSNVRNGVIMDCLARDNEAGIYLTSCNDNSIINNVAINNVVAGIMMDNCDNNQIIGNQANNNYLSGILAGGYSACDFNLIQDNKANHNHVSRGIQVHGTYNTIDNNEVSYNYVGMSIGGSYNTISTNFISHSSSYGIQSLTTSYFNISNNKITSSNQAIYTYRFHWATIYSNELYGNTVGINLHESNNNRIYGNNIHDNTQDGIRIHPECYDNIITENILSGNYQGVNCHSSSNIFYQNEFISNDINAVDEGTNNQWDNGAIGNYWDDYPFYDADDDLIGDKPFPVPGAALSQDNYPIWDDGPGIPDTDPPITQIYLEGDKGPEGWYITDVSVSLSATDNFAGVLITMYRIDGGPWEVYDTSFTISKEGDTLIEFYSIDYFDNIESVKSSLFRIVKAPEVNAGADQVVYEGSSVVFSGTYTDPGDTSVHTILWDFGDGTTATTLNPSHIYTDNGVYTVILTIEDGYGGIGTDELIVTVENVAPILSNLHITTIDEGDYSTLSGNIIDPSIDDTFKLTVDWGDGMPVDIYNFPPGTTSFSKTHLFIDNGVYTVSLTLTDDDGGIAADFLTVTVNEVAPILTLSGDSEVDEGSTYTLYLDSYDPGDDTIFQWVIDWGDGNIQTIVGNPSSVTHIYKDGPNIYKITATASDEDGTYGLLGAIFGFELGDFTDWIVYVPYGGSAQVVQSHNTDYPSYITYYPADGTYFACLKADGPGSYTSLKKSVYLLAGQAISGWAAFDAWDYMPFNDNAMVRILNEDGSQIIAQPWYSDVNLVGDYGETPWQEWSFTAPSDGYYIVEYRVANSLDSVLDSYALFDGEVIGMPVLVNNVAPSVNAGPDVMFDEDLLYDFICSFSDPGILDTHTAVIDWGDGSLSDIGYVVESDGSGTVSGSHIYLLPGFYTITITVTDSDTDARSDTLIINIVDKTAPTTTITIQGPFTEPNFVSTATTFILEAEDAEMPFGSGVDLIQYRIDDGVWTDYDPLNPFNIAEIGEHTIYYRSIDVAENIEEEKSLVVIVNATELTYLNVFEGTYSDPVILQARLIDIATQLPITGKSIEFTLGGQTTNAITQSDGIAYATLILDQPAGIYSVSAAFEGNEYYLASDSEMYDFMINKEYAYAEYTGNLVVPTTYETITLRATVFDDDDGNWGDLTKIYITIKIYNSLTLELVCSYAHLEVSTTSVEGVGVALITIPILPEEGYIVEISFNPTENDYFWGESSEWVTLTIYEPSGDFITGGGWIEDSKGNKGNFGFNVKYKKNGLPKGQATFVYRDGEYTYIIKSNAWIGMAINSEENYTIFEAKCNIKKVNSDGIIVWEEGNYRLVIEAWDHSQDGKSDVIQIRVFDKIGLVYHEVGYDPYGILGGGNIVIHVDEKK